MTGRIGACLAGYLTAQGIAILGVVRDPKKVENWTRQGAKSLPLSPRAESLTLSLASHGNR
ncbi:hypothetical protein [Tunturiibacter psychrotolerans]|uniref:hypothetical protein n=1 Tax=Tunturiibacter psychrotolerans TaxID=3069686 RepID=UPI003D2325AC